MGWFNKCDHRHTHLCKGSEDLLHILHQLNIKSARAPLMRIGVSVEGKRYIFDGGLFDMKNGEYV